MLRYLPPLCWTGLIMYLSGGQWSGEHTSSWFGPMLRALFPWVSPGLLDAVHLVVRKTAHVSEYGVLALLWRRATGQSQIALGLSLLTACVDEIHQAFTPGREGSIYDVLLDGAGAAVALFLRSVLVSWWRKAPS